MADDRHEKAEVDHLSRKPLTSDDVKPKPKRIARILRLPRRR